MIRLLALQAALTGLIGLRPHYEPNRAQYAQDLLVSSSGIWLNDVHPLITAENLLECLPKFSVLNYAEYASGNTYQRGAIARLGQQLYILMGTDTGAGPGVASEWLKTDYISAKLRQCLDSAVAGVANALIQQKKIEGARTVINETKLFNSAGNINNRVIKMGRFCGFEIDVKPIRDIVIRITQVALQSDTGNPDLELYIYHTSFEQPLLVFKPGFTNSGIYSWAESNDIYLALDAEAFAPGGSFLIGYYESDVQGQVIERVKDFTNAVAVGVGCNACDPSEVIAFETWSKYMMLHPFTVAANYLNNDRSLFDDNRIAYNYKTNYGLNINISLECDITQFLVRHKMLIADALSKQAAVNILQIFANTTENNAVAEKVKQLAMYQLDNRSDNQRGLLSQLDKSLSALSLDVADDNSPCLPTFPVSKGRITTGASGNQNLDGAPYYGYGH